MDRQRKVVNHHNEVPFYCLQKKYFFNDKNSKNMIVHGDNLYALKSLLPQFENCVDVVYIDPPYNTGNEGWVYNDNVNDPRIKEWLGKVVGAEGEDFSRHDKWLCMMYPRIQLLRKLLSPNGRIFISIDENELYNLKLICDEIFGPNNFIGQFMWFKSATPPNLSYKLKRNLEYVLCYEKHKNNTRYTGIQKISNSDDPFTKPQNSFKKLSFKPGVINFKGEDGVYPAGTYGTDRFPNKLLNDMIIKDGKNANEVTFENRFIWVQETLDKNIEENVRINLSKSLVLSYKRANYNPEVPPNLIDKAVGVDTTEEAGKRLKEIFGKNPFDYPKDVSLIKYLLKFVDKKDAIVLDCFAGSGTTAQSVLELNNEDGGSRRFILCEMMDYAETIVAERCRKLSNGTNDLKLKNVDFCFYELGERIFDDAGNINPKIDINDLRKYIYYVETKQEPDTNKNNKYFLGSYNKTSYYFVYEKDEITKLDYSFLKQLVKKDESYIIYADVCYLSEYELKKYGIVFKKIPRDIERI